ncbi:MAG TPA: methylated-DNA--[protein]-cysteine S-methyltransferase [Jatrophihabitans sp.]|nr:methylated-DNA--[protein]-cysteine S-methyltransferase [Jatrophihabitans sp.]
MTGYALFETAIGTCGIGWTEAGIRRVVLPGRSAEQTRAMLAGDPMLAGEPVPGEPMLAGEPAPGREAIPPPAVAATIAGIVRLLDGADEDLAGAELDETGVTGFNRQVYAVARSIRPGSTLTYGEVATRLGQPGAARAVGRALGDNPYPIVVPCHRVLAADGSLHGFSAYGGLATKRRMLQLEGALPPDEPTLF